MRTVIPSYLLSFFFLSGCASTPAPADEKEDHSRTYYFASVSPDAFKKTPLYDYLQLTLHDSTFEGKGVGNSDGSPDWIEHFNGRLRDTVMQVIITYQEDGGKPFTHAETWHLAHNRKYIFRDDCPALKNLYGAKEYHAVAKKDIVKYSADRLDAIP